MRLGCPALGPPRTPATAPSRARRRAPYIRWSARGVHGSYECSRAARGEHRTARRCGCRAHRRVSPPRARSAYRPWPRPHSGEARPSEDLPPHLRSQRFRVTSPWTIPSIDPVSYGGSSDMKPGYWIARSKILDEDRYFDYVRQAGAASKEFGAQILARGGRFELLEGSSI